MNELNDDDAGRPAAEHMSVDVDPGSDNSDSCGEEELASEGAEPRGDYPYSEGSHDDCTCYVKL